MGRPPGTTVFVGNISYDTTEDQLKDVFSQVGNVVSFRLMYDHETGRAKGFGFCEYEDKETAMSARRNLNGTQLNGRPLRVDLTDSDKNNPALNGLALNPPSKGPAINPPLHIQSSQMQHPALPASLASANPSMAMMSLADIHKTMVHLKKAVVQNPNEIRELLMANPRLAHAILQGQIMLGMVPPPMMPPPPQQHPKRQQTAIQPQPAPPRQQIPQRQNVQQRPPMQPRPNIHAQQIPQHPPMQQLQQPQNAPPSMMQPRMMQHPQMQPPLQQSQASMEEQAAILNTVMNMTQEQIDELSAEDRSKVMEIKQILSMQNAGGIPPGVTQQMAPGMQPGIQPGMQPGMPPGMPPGAQPPPPPVGQAPAPPQQPYR